MQIKIYEALLMLEERRLSWLLVQQFMTSEVLWSKFMSEFKKTIVKLYESDWLKSLPISEISEI